MGEENVETRHMDEQTESSSVETNDAGEPSQNEPQPDDTEDPGED